jgi:alpha-amylase/alpha-mannosidase (GH57 family)
MAIKFAFLFHFHQPLYKDLFTSRILLPWVRLHGIKDYYGMALLFKKFPQIKATLNFSGSLLMQIEDYSKGFYDDYFHLTRKDPSELNPVEIEFMLKNFFMVNKQTVLLPNKRYYELYEVSKRCEIFEYQDLLDLQVLSNIVWLHPLARKEDPQLEELALKGRNYTTSDKELLLSKELRMLENIIPLWRELAQSGQIEITASPYYHPILPLLAEDPALKEDASSQIKSTLELLREKFSLTIKGVWPPEGGVSEDILPILKENSILWIATDQDILEHSLEDRFSKELIYKPYLHPKSGIYLIFRDKELSNLIGFHYKSWDPEKAATDFIQRLKTIGRSLHEPFVAVILDGENPWEYYPNNGIDFLTRLYEFLSEDKEIQTVQISEYLKDPTQMGTLEKLYAGSWIDHSFDVWQAHPEDKKAWELVFHTRRELMLQRELEEERKKFAWQSIYAAEGSDWFWWFGDEFYSPQTAEFDILFRKHLINVYCFMGKIAPEELFREIKKTPERELYTQPWALLKVKVDGKRSDYFEWIAAGHYSVRNELSTMHIQTPSLIADIYFGFDEENFYLRADPLPTKEGMEKFKLSRISVVLTFPKKITIFADSLGVNFSLRDFLELSIPLEKLGIHQDRNVRFHVECEEIDGRITRLPLFSSIEFSLRTRDLEKIYWAV